MTFYNDWQSFCHTAAYPKPVDINPTSKDEQRTTLWMPYESLNDFLDLQDSTKTIKGYPAPLRATFIAQKP